MLGQFVYLHRHPELGNLVRVFLEGSLQVGNLVLGEDTAEAAQLCSQLIAQGVLESAARSLEMGW